jgi:hypothetical protein
MTTATAQRALRKMCSTLGPKYKLLFPRPEQHPHHEQVVIATIGRGEDGVLRLAARRDLRFDLKVELILLSIPKTPSEVQFDQEA